MMTTSMRTWMAMLGALMIAMGIFYIRLDEADRTAPATDAEKESFTGLASAATALATVVLIWAIGYAYIWFNKGSSSARSECPFWLPQLMSTGVAVTALVASAPHIEIDGDQEAKTVDGEDMDLRAIGGTCMGMGGAVLLYCAYMVACKCDTDEFTSLCWARNNLFNSGKPL